MKYEVKLEGRTRIRTLDELKHLLNHCIENENYEQCSVIKYAIDNYQSLIKEMKIISTVCVIKENNRVLMLLRTPLDRTLTQDKQNQHDELYR